MRPSLAVSPGNFFSTAVELHQTSGTEDEDEMTHTLKEEPKEQE
jgi:hypothetical protein